MSFQQVPVLDLQLAFNIETKNRFLEELRYALVDVGFLLLVNHELVGPSREDFEEIKEEANKFFSLPDEVKLACEMTKSPHFLGYTKLANEVTALHTDWREQIDLATELPAPGPDEPIYKNIEGPNLWPDENHIPNFKPTVTMFIEKMTRLSTEFRQLACQAIGLPSDALNKYFKPNQQCKMKIIAYPDRSQLSNAHSEALDDTPSTEQGCGPHRDSDFLTYIYQATNHQDSLQVQNFQGKWITVENVPNSLVVNAGQTLEALTQGVCKATIHRVLIPKAGSGTRISIPFFLTIDLDSRKSAVSHIPAEVLRMRDQRDKKIEDWAADVGFQFIPDMDKQPVGYAVFKNRIKSHQDVAARWYPDILAEVLKEY